MLFNNKAVFKLVINVVAVFFTVFNVMIQPNNYALSFVVSLVVIVFSLKDIFTKLDLSFWFVISYIALFYINPLFFEFMGMQQTDTFGIIPRDSISLFSVYTIVSIHIFLFVNSIFSLKDKNEYLNEMTVGFIETKRLYFAFILLFITIFLLVFVDIGFSSITSLTRTELRDSRGGLTLLAVYLSYSSLPLVFLAGVSYRLKSSLMLVVLVLLLDIFIFLVFRIRTFILAHIICFFAGFFIASSSFVGFKSIYKKLVIYFPMIVLLLIFMRFFRGYFELYGFWDAVSKVELSAAIQETIILGDLGYSPVVMRVFELYSNESDLLLGDSYLKFFKAFLPDIIGGEKIVDTQLVIGEKFYPGVSGMSLPPGVQGDAFINFGIWGIGMFFLYGILFSISTKISLSNKIVIFFCSFTTIFHFVRGAFSNPIIIFLVLVISTVFFTKYIGFKMVRKHE